MASPPAGVADHGPPRVARLERLLVAAAAALFLHLVLFRDGIFVYQFHRASSGVWIDEGIRAAGGELIYRDFDETIGPGLVYLNAILAGLFDARLDAFAYAGLALGVMLTAAIHALAGVFVASRWRLLPPLLFLVLVYAPSELGHPRWPALLLGIAGVALGASRPTPGAALGSGLALGAAVLCARDVGTGVALGLAAFFASAPRARLSAFLAGTLASVALVMAGLAAAAGPSRVIEAWLIRPLWQAWRDSSLQLIAPWHPRSVAQLAMAIACCISGARLLGNAQRPVTLNEPLGGMRALCFCGFGLFASSIPGTVDTSTLAVHTTLLSVPLAWSLERLCAQPASLKRWLAPAVLGLLLPGLLHGSAGLVIRRQWTDALVRQRFRAGEAWLGAPNLELPWLESRARPGEYVFAFPAGGLSYGLTRTRNATSFPSMIEGRSSREQQTQALAEIAARRPAVGLWWTSQRFSPPPGAASLDTLYQGLLRAYAVERVLPSGALLLARHPGADSARGSTARADP